MESAGPTRPYFAASVARTRLERQSTSVPMRLVAAELLGAWVGEDDSDEVEGASVAVLGAWVGAAVPGASVAVLGAWVGAAVPGASVAVLGAAVGAAVGAVVYAAYAAVTSACVIAPE